MERDIKVLMAKNYIDNLSEETSQGMTEKGEQLLVMDGTGHCSKTEVPWNRRE